MNLEFSITERTFRDEVHPFLTEKLTQDFRIYTSLMTSAYSDEPKANVIGDVDKGWTVAKYLLEFERGGTAYCPQLQQRLNKIQANAHELGALDSPFAQKLAQATVDVTALEYVELRLMADLSEGGTPGFAPR